MTRRLFQAVAEVLTSVELAPHQRRELAERFAELFSASNSRFSRERFFTACGVASDEPSE